MAESLITSLLQLPFQTRYWGLLLKADTQNSLSEYFGETFFQKNGYTNIRIPGLISLENGTMLCCFECRRGGDWSPIDIAVQVSNDGGVSWSAPKTIVSGKGRNTMNNPLLIADGNRVHLLYCENYKRLFYTFSDDCGEHFSTARELTEQIDSQTQNLFWSVLAAGPGHGIRLQNGSLLVPVWFGQNRTDMFAHHPSVISVLRSENGGKDWRLSPLIGEGILRDPSECCLAECGGKVILNIRNENDAHARAVSESTDGGKTWTVPVFDPSLPDPTCCAGLCGYGDSLYFSNCASKKTRTKLTVKQIDPDGKIAASLLVSKTGGYSDICINKKYDSLFVVFENETKGLKTAHIKI